MVINQTDIVRASMPTPSGEISFNLSSTGDLDYIVSLIRMNGLANYEPPAPSVFAELVKESSDVVLDVGANTGIFALLAASANRAVTVHAFEPLDSARERLMAHLACNPGLAPRITVEPLALSHTRGSAAFFETINDQGLISTSSSLELGHAQRVGPYAERRAPTDTLDAWTAATGQRRIQLLKIDVEGHEHAVIQGGKQTIHRDRPFILAEILGAADVSAISRVLAEANYLDLAMRQDGLYRQTSLQFQPDAWNHLFCPQEAAGRLAAICARLELYMNAG